MKKRNTPLRYIFKISTTRLKKAKWNIALSIEEARNNDEVITIGDSQVLRWIDELNETTDISEQVRLIRRKIRDVKRLPYSVKNKHLIKKLYQELDRLQFKPDFVNVVIDKPKDLIRASKGFKINGISYVRLLGTSGGVKNSTIIFVNAALAPELNRRINNGRNMEVPQIPAKFEAYKALTCSGSTPVSLPRGILVVPDCETHFKEDIIMLNDEGDGEPKMEEIDQYEVTLDESDGYGLMLPALAQRWSEELGLDYVASGMNTRFSWEKGMVFTFDFIDFADKIAHKYIVKDAWGAEVDIREVELILTTSMLKLWKSYDSFESYLSCCLENHYTFGIPKVCPRELEQTRDLNYQFIQSYQLTDDQIEELIAPTINHIKEVMTGDYRKALVYLCGQNLNDEAVEHLDVCDCVKSIMADSRMFDDPHVKKYIHHLIERSIDNAKIGVVSVHGNYSILCGDPYALCQSIFGLEVTGLLKAGEIYNRFWVDSGSDSVACFRAPMTCHNNIKKMKVANSEEISYWYQHMTTCTMLNAWDTTADALNGADKDGDLIFLTDNKILVDNVRPTRTIFCVQRKGKAKIVTDEDLINANIASFGDDIGKTTNRITAMFEVQSMFSPDSEEYKILEYRIQCGQLFQQNAIDRVKGIIAKPIPREWYDRHSAAAIEDPQKKELYMRILADRKPYFMKYIYAPLMKQYTTYMRHTSEKCMMLFRTSISELGAMPIGDLTNEQFKFLWHYRDRMPVGVNNCVMNRICHRFEDEFDGIVRTFKNATPFDYSIMKSGVPYTRSQYDKIVALYENHNAMVQQYIRTRKAEFRQDSAIDIKTHRHTFIQQFESKCYSVCSNAEQLCDIILDICYSKEGTKQFAWDVCGNVMIHNLLVKHEEVLLYPMLDPDGEFEYNGLRFAMKQKRSNEWMNLS